MLLNDLGLDVIGLLGGVGLEASHVMRILGFDVLHQRRHRHLKFQMHKSCVRGDNSKHGKLFRRLSRVPFTRHGPHRPRKRERREGGKKGWGGDRGRGDRREGEKKVVGNEKLTDAKVKVLTSLI